MIDTCAICRGIINDICIDCQANQVLFLCCLSTFSFPCFFVSCSCSCFFVSCSFDGSCSCSCGSCSHAGSCCCSFLALSVLVSCRVACSYSSLCRVFVLLQLLLICFLISSVCFQASATSDECTIAWGYCNHAFHFHCISKWLRKRPNCPLDNQEWLVRFGLGKICGFHRFLLQGVPQVRSIKKRNFRQKCASSLPKAVLPSVDPKATLGDRF
jgi:hypothetical protein